MAADASPDVHKPRASSGGGKYGAGDMAEHLERMGRQLAQIEAQHHQMAKRDPDRENLAAAKARYLSRHSEHSLEIEQGLYDSEGMDLGCINLDHQNNSTLLHPRFILQPRHTSPHSEFSGPSSASPTRPSMRAILRRSFSNGDVPSSTSASSAISARRSLAWDADHQRTPVNGQSEQHRPSSLSDSSGSSCSRPRSASAASIGPGFSPPGSASRFARRMLHAAAPHPPPPRRATVDSAHAIIGGRSPGSGRPPFSPSSQPPRSPSSMQRNGTHSAVPKTMAPRRRSAGGRSSTEGVTPYPYSRARASSAAAAIGRAQVPGQHAFAEGSPRAPSPLANQAGRQMESALMPQSASYSLNQSGPARASESAHALVDAMLWSVTGAEAVKSGVCALPGAGHGQIYYDSRKYDSSGSGSDADDPARGRSHRSTAVHLPKGLALRTDQLSPYGNSPAAAQRPPLATHVSNDPSYSEAHTGASEGSIVSNSNAANESRSAAVRVPFAGSPSSELPAKLARPLPGDHYPSSAGCPAVDHGAISPDLSSDVINGGQSLVQSGDSELSLTSFSPLQQAGQGLAGGDPAFQYHVGSLANACSKLNSQHDEQDEVADSSLIYSSPRNLHASLAAAAAVASAAAGWANAQLSRLSDDSVELDWRLLQQHGMQRLSQTLDVGLQEQGSFMVNSVLQGSVDCEAVNRASAAAAEAAVATAANHAAAAEAAATAAANHAAAAAAALVLPPSGITTSNAESHPPLHIRAAVALSTPLQPAAPTDALGCSALPPLSFFPCIPPPPSHHATSTYSVHSTFSAGTVGNSVSVGGGPSSPSSARCGKEDSVLFGSPIRAAVRADKVSCRGPSTAAAPVHLLQASIALPTTATALTHKQAITDTGLVSQSPSWQQQHQSADNSHVTPSNPQLDPQRIIPSPPALNPSSPQSSDSRRAARSYGSNSCSSDLSLKAAAIISAQQRTSDCGSVLREPSSLHAHVDADWSDCSNIVKPGTLPHATALGLPASQSVAGADVAVMQLAASSAGACAMPSALNQRSATARATAAAAAVADLAAAGTPLQQRSSAHSAYVSAFPLPMSAAAVTAPHAGSTSNDAATPRSTCSLAPSAAAAIPTFCPADAQYDAPVQPDGPSSPHAPMSTLAKLQQLKLRRQQQQRQLLGVPSSPTLGHEGYTASSGALLRASGLMTGRSPVATNHQSNCSASHEDKHHSHGCVIVHDIPPTQEQGAASISSSADASPFSTTAVHGSTAHMLHGASHVRPLHLVASGDMTLGHGPTGTSVEVDRDHVQWAWHRPGDRLDDAPGAGPACIEEEQWSAGHSPEPPRGISASAANIDNVHQHAGINSAALQRLKQYSRQRHQATLPQQSGDLPVAASSDSPRRQVGTAGTLSPNRHALGFRAGVLDSSTAESPYLRKRPANKRQLQGVGEGSEGNAVEGHATSVKDGVVGEEVDSVPAKPFLRRRSAKVASMKVDWSHVKPKTVSRMDPHEYTPVERHASPRRVPVTAWNAAGNKGRGPAPISSAPSPYNPNHRRSSPPGSPLAAAARAKAKAVGQKANWRPSAKLPVSPKEREAAEERSRRRSTVPPASADYEVTRVTSTYYPSGDRRLNKPSGAGLAGRYAGASAYSQGGREVYKHSEAVMGDHGGGGGAHGGPASRSPLDDLLSHVNHLLKDFDSSIA